MTETEERERINREIGERRTRLGARLADVTVEVRREVYDRSDLEIIYQSIIDWTNDDELRRNFEEKLLQRAYDTLVVLPDDERKHVQREKVARLANGMVIIKHPFFLAWQLELEWKDVDSVADLNAGVLRDFVSFFPGNGLAKVICGYFRSEISPFPIIQEENEESEENGEQQITEMMPEEILLLMSVSHQPYAPRFFTYAR